AIQGCGKKAVRLMIQPWRRGMLAPRFGERFDSDFRMNSAQSPSEGTANKPSYCFYWRSRPDSNRCTSLERAMSWASRRRERKCRAVARARYYRDPSRLLKLKAF